MFNSRFLLEVGFVMSLTACSVLSSTAQSAENKIEKKEVKVNQSFTVELAGNRTTAYMWEIKDVPEKVKLVEQHYQRSDNCKLGMVGCGGKEIFTFQAKQPGKANLVFDYRRPWERENGQTRTVEVNIQDYLVK